MFLMTQQISGAPYNTKVTSSNSVELNQQIPKSVCVCSVCKANKEEGPNVYSSYSLGTKCNLVLYNQGSGTNL